MDIQKYDEKDTSWLETLALDEINMEESGVVKFYNHLDPALHLEESSINFVNELRELFEIALTRFNSFRGGKESGAAIKIFSISGTVNDFMLYRNSLKLLVSRRANDLLAISFLSNTGGSFAAQTEAAFSSQPLSHHEIKAHVGPFSEISWRYNGDTVNPYFIVKHYLTEFVKNSSN